jgi:hypothetical protein
MQFQLRSYRSAKRFLRSHKCSDLVPSCTCHPAPAFATGQRELVGLDPVHTLYFFQIKNLISSGNKDQIDILFRRLDRNGDELLNQADFTHYDPVHRDILRKLWIVISQQFDCKATINSDDFFEGFVLSCYLEVLLFISKYHFKFYNTVENLAIIIFSISDRSEQSVRLR